MTLLRRLFNFYVDASIHVGIAVCCFYQITCLELDITPSLDYGATLLTGSVLVYNFMKYGVEAHRYFFVSNLYYKRIRTFSFLLGILLLYFLIRLSIFEWFSLGILTLISGIYALPIFPNKIKLRHFGLVKIVVVTLVWTGVTAIIPLMQSQEIMWVDIVPYTLQRGGYVLALIIPFEIRDVGVDNPTLKTIPQRVGVYPTKVLGMCMIVWSLVIGLTFMPRMMSTYALALGTAIAIAMTSHHYSKYYASFWVESIPIWVYLILLMGLLF